MCPTRHPRPYPLTEGHGDSGRRVTAANGAERAWLKPLAFLVPSCLSFLKRAPLFWDLLFPGLLHFNKPTTKRVPLNSEALCLLLSPALLSCICFISQTDCETAKEDPYLTTPSAELAQTSTPVPQMAQILTAEELIQFLSLQLPDTDRLVHERSFIQDHNHSSRVHCQCQRPAPTGLSHQRQRQQHSGPC